MKLKLLSLSLIFCAGLMSAQTYQVPVTEDDEPMMQGQFQPTWKSLSSLIRYPNGSAMRKFSRTADGLEITLPDKPLNRIFPIFKIQK